MAEPARPEHVPGSLGDPEGDEHDEPNTIAHTVQLLRGRRDRDHPEVEDHRRRSASTTSRPTSRTARRDRLAHLDLDRTDDVWSPRAALVFQPTPAQTYYFAWGTVVQPVGGGADPRREHRQHAARRGRSPTSWARSGSSCENRLSLNTALFRIEKTDARTAEPGSLVQTLDGKQRSQGFEIEVVGRPLPNWNIFAGYTYLDTKVLRVQGRARAASRSRASG